MITKEKSFYSDGYRLSATLYLPDDYQKGEKRPCIIPNSGYIGLNTIYPALYARALTTRGFVCFGFDYRGFSDSEGSAGVCKLDEQVEDIRSAVTFVQTLSEADPKRIGLIGWGMAAGLVARVAQVDRRIKAAAGLNGFYSGRRWLKRVYSDAEYLNMKAMVSREMTRFAVEGKRRFADPFLFYPLDPATEAIVDKDLYTVSGYGQEISMEIGRSILEFDAEKNISDIVIPMFIGHGVNNHLHPISEAEEFYKKLRAPKRYYVIDGKHNDFMFDDHPEFVKLIDQLDDFFQVL